MNASGRFVVVWDTDGSDVFAQIFDPAGNRVGGEFRVHADANGTQQFPDLVMDDAGNFVVMWNGNGTDDADGVFARRFDANGVPLGTVNEVQRLEILGPPAQWSTFTLQLAGETTGLISCYGIGNSLLTARNIQDALRGLPSTGNQVTVTAVATDEVQTITFSGDPTSGTFDLDFGGSITTPIDFAGPGAGATTAQNIQDALRALPNLGDQLTVVAISDYEYAVTFLGPDGGTDQPLLVVSNNALDQGTIAITETVPGLAAEDSLLSRSSLPVVTAQDQPLLVHGDRLSGVTHLNIEQHVQGSTGEFRVSNYIPNAQSLVGTGIDASGNFTAVWQSAEQDGSNLGVFGKRFDASGVAQPGDRDERQQISLLGPPVIGSNFRLGFDGLASPTILYTGQNAVDAAAIQSALRNLPNLGNSLTVRPASGTSDEVQRIQFTGAPTTGTFVLAHAGLITAPITFAGPNPADGLTTAANIVDAFANLTPSVSVTVVPTIVDSATDFLVTFTGADGNIDQPLIFLVQSNLDAGTAAISTVNDGAHSTTDFIVDFLGVDGRKNQPELTLAASSGGIIGIDTTTLIDGANSEFPVNEIITGNQSNAALAVTDTGQMLVAWQGVDSDLAGIYARLFDADGNALTGDILVNTFSERNQLNPAVTVDIDGNFIVSWTSEGQDGSLGGIYARRLDPSGRPLGDEFLVNPLTVGNQRDVDLVGRPDGSFVVAWASEAGRGGIHARRLRDGWHAAGRR